MWQPDEFEGNDKYTVIKLLGRGAFGIVYKVSCNKDDTKYALKHIFKTGRTSSSAAELEEAGPSTAERPCSSHKEDGEPPRKKTKVKIPKAMVKTLKEYKMLRKCGRSKTITSLIDAYDHKQKDGNIFPHLVMELCHCDLTDLWPLELTISKEQHRWLTFMVLSGVQFIHKQHVFHRDLKSQNVLVCLTNTIQLKLADFGSAMEFNGITAFIDDSPTFSTPYRPPEVHLGAKHYRVNSDLWCAGLIIAEMQWKKTVIDQDRYDESMGQVCGRITNACAESFKIKNKQKLTKHNNCAKRDDLMVAINKKINDNRCIGEILEQTLCSPHRRATANELVIQKGKQLCKGKPQLLKDLATEMKTALGLL